jgi:GT2 family glycosyltransferase
LRSNDFRANKFGFRSYVTAKVLVYHKIQASAGVRGTNRLSPITAYYSARGSLSSVFLLTSPLSIMRITSIMANCCVLFPFQMWRSRNVHVIIPYIQGLFDAMRGRLGPWKVHMLKDGRTLDGQKVR